MFKPLLKKKQDEYRQWARDNYTSGDAINICWHPVIRAECERINVENWEQR